MTMVISKILPIPDVSQDLHNWPPETRISHSTRASFLSFGSILGYIGLAVSFFLIGKGVDLIVPFPIIVLSSILLVWNLRNAVNQKVQIMVSDRGLQTAKSGFHAWPQIRELSIGNEGTGSYPEHMLRFEHPGGKVWIRVGTLEADWEQIAYILKVYMTRYQIKQALADRLPVN